MIFSINISRSTFFLLSLLFVLSVGCTPVKYSNKNYPSDQQDHYYKIDSAECQAVAAGISPMPQIHINQQGAQYGSGTFNFFGSNGYNNYGYYNQTTLYRNSTAQFADIANMGTFLAAQVRQDNLYKACMARRGWVEVKEDTEFEADPSLSLDEIFKEAEWELINEALAKEDYTTAARFTHGLAETGDPEGQHLLGLIYFTGKGVSQNNEQALRWFHLAAENGNHLSQYMLADIYYSGVDGIPQNYENAFKWAKLSAKQGNSNAEFLLGAMYAMGHGTSQNYQKAAKWTHLAADQGNTLAFLPLGALYFQGKGVPQNYIKAHAWYNLAAANGDEPALECRDIVAGVMTASQIAEAQKLASEWAERINSSNQ
jgi:hypothetical protein